MSLSAEILCVGTELLLGDVVNTNAAAIAKGLAQIGVGCYYQSVVGDNPGRLRASLELAFSRADVVVMTGGLGPTYDDLTKETVAQFFGRELVTHQPSLDHLTAVFAAGGRPMTENNLRQALMPAGAVVFPNDRGTANGLALEDDGRIAVLLPGPPREMTAMLDAHVLPFLAGRSGRTFVSHTVHLFGIGESAVEAQLPAALRDGVNPTVAPYAKEGEVHLRVTASGTTTEEADALTRPVLAELEALLGDRVYGIDAGSLEQALVTELTRAGLTVATAESCTGGLVSARITSIPGSSAVFGYGLATYANEAKALVGVDPATLAEHGAVSREVAEQMAAGVRALARADIGVALTGVAGPDGGTPDKPVGLVWLGLAGPDGVSTTELRLSRGYGDERALIRHLAANHALAAALREARRIAMF